MTQSTGSESTCVRIVKGTGDNITGNYTINGELKINNLILYKEINNEVNMIWN